MLHEHSRAEQDRPSRGLGHELLVHDREEILAGETTLHLLLFGRHRNRVVFLDQQTVTGPLWRSAWGSPSRYRRCGTDRACGSNDRSHQGPRSCCCADRRCRNSSGNAPPPLCCHAPSMVGMHRPACIFNRAIALARETISQAEEGAALLPRRRAIASIFPAGTPQIASAHSGVRDARCASNSGVKIREPRHVIAVGEAFAQQNMQEPVASAPSVPGARAGRDRPASWSRSCRRRPRQSACHALSVP